MCLAFNVIFWTDSSVIVQDYFNYAAFRLLTLGCYKVLQNMLRLRVTKQKTHLTLKVKIAIMIYPK